MRSHRRLGPLHCSIPLLSRPTLALALALALSQVAKGFAGMTKGSPLWEAVGTLPSADRPADTVCSYASVHDALGAKTLGYADKYQQFVVEYAVEWEKAVTTRINDGLKKADELRRDLDHYQKKVEALRLSVNQSMAKGKNVKSDAQEKLRRNEEKLLKAKQGYNQLATDLCILMEEVTQRSWRDLHPLIVKCAQFDSTLSSDETKALASLNQVVSALKGVATANGISPQPRLKDLANLKPELLSTRPGGVQGLMLENGPASGPMGGGSGTFGGASASSPIAPGYMNQALAPGSLAASGLGGFPVQISGGSDPVPQYGSATTPTASGSSHFGGLDPYASPPTYDPPSTLSMLTISQSSAPAPTLDDVYGSSSSGTGLSPMAGGYPRSAPGSGNLPPLGPPRTGSFNRSATTSGSFYDSDNNSTYSSGYYSAPPSLSLAAAPVAPPPPPPSMPPPPPPPSYGMAPNMYGGGTGMPPPMAPQQPYPGMAMNGGGGYQAYGQPLPSAPNPYGGGY